MNESTVQSGAERMHAAVSGQGTFSLWLLPTHGPPGAADAMGVVGAVQHTIAGLAAAHEVPPFPAHVTLASGFVGHQQEVIARCRALAGRLEAMELVTGEVLHSDHFFRSIVLDVGLTPELAAGNNHCCPPDRSVDAFNPHLSLMYRSITITQPHLPPCAVASPSYTSVAYTCTHTHMHTHTRHDTDTDRVYAPMQCLRACMSSCRVVTRRCVLLRAFWHHPHHPPHYPICCITPHHLRVIWLPVASLCLPVSNKSADPLCGFGVRLCRPFAPARARARPLSLSRSVPVYACVTIGVYLQPTLVGPGMGHIGTGALTRQPVLQQSKVCAEPTCSTNTTPLRAPGPCPMLKRRVCGHSGGTWFKYVRCDTNMCIFGSCHACRMCALRTLRRRVSVGRLCRTASRLVEQDAEPDDALLSCCGGGYVHAGLHVLGCGRHHPAVIVRTLPTTLLPTPGCGLQTLPSAQKCRFLMENQRKRCIRKKCIYCSS